MNIRTKEEIQALDEDLKLFQESDWEFMSVLATHDTNYEYFNDIKDTDFETRGTKTSTVILSIGFIALAGALSFAGYKYLNKPNTEYNNIANMTSVNDKHTLKRIHGSATTNEDLSKITGVLNTYIGVLNKKSSYEPLYAICSPTSTFADTYNTTVNKVEIMYDKHDGYARSLREFASYYTLGKINQIVKKDGVFYCYTDILMPSTTDITEYVYAYSYNFTKEFSKYLPTESALIKYLLELTNENPIPCSVSEVLIKFDEGYNIIDDSFVTSNCIDLYTLVLSKIREQLKDKPMNIK